MGGNDKFSWKFYRTMNKDDLKQMLFLISTACDSPNCHIPHLPHFPYDHVWLLNFPYLDHFPNYLMFLWVSFLDSSLTDAFGLCSFAHAIVCRYSFGWVLIWWAICEFWLSRSLVGSLNHLPFIWWCKWPIAPAIS